MKVLADTHILIRAADHPDRLSFAAVASLSDAGNDLYFSPLSIWEVAVKGALGREDFQFDPRTLHMNLLSAGSIELPLASEHAMFVQSLPALHQDRVDRLLIAQATVENMPLITVDDNVAQYLGPIHKV